MNKKNDPLKIHCFRIQPQLLKRVEAKAKANGITASAFIRGAVELAIAQTCKTS